jgi:hypothetical protein
MSDVEAIDPYLDRAAAAAYITAHCYPVTSRGLRDWADPRTIIINNRACARRSEWRAEAERRLREAHFQGAEARVAQNARARQVYAAMRGRVA